MIPWPYVSRRAFDLVMAERDRVVAQNERLTEHIMRMDRLEHGVGEIQPELKPPPEPMTQDVVDWIRRWDSPITREELTRQAERLYARYRDWDMVLNVLVKSEEQV